MRIGEYVYLLVTNSKKRSTEPPGLRQLTKSIGITAKVPFESLRAFLARGSLSQSCPLAYVEQWLFLFLKNSIKPALVRNSV